MSAQADLTIDFEDLNQRTNFTSWGIRDNYQGFDWGYGNAPGPTNRLFIDTSTGWASATTTVPISGPLPEAVGGSSVAWNWNGPQSLWIDFRSLQDVTSIRLASANNTTDAWVASTLQVFGYDAEDNLLGSSSLLDVTDTFQTLDINIADVTYLEIRANDDNQWFSIDDLIFGLVSPTITNDGVEDLLSVTEANHELAREQLDTHMLVSRNYQCGQGVDTCIYASGFAADRDSYTLGSTMGLAWHATDTLKVGAGVFVSKYSEDDYDSEYELDSLGATAWLDYRPAPKGLRINAVAMYGDMDSDIDRSYVVGTTTLDKSKGDTDGEMYGVLARVGWEFGMNEQTNLTPYVDYTWTYVEVDSYTEKSGAYPAYFDKREDNGHTVRIGLEVKSKVSSTFDSWGQIAYGNRLDDDSESISGTIIGVTDFAYSGYSLDNDWIEADVGGRWHVAPKLSVVGTLGITADSSDVQPNYRGSIGLTWDL